MFFLEDTESFGIVGDVNWIASLEDEPRYDVRKGLDGVTCERKAVSWKTISWVLSRDKGGLVWLVGNGNGEKQVESRYSLKVEVTRLKMVWECGAKWHGGLIVDSQISGFTRY